MAKRLSFQQLQVLRRLNLKPQSANKFTDLYTYANLYRALNTLERKGLIVKKDTLYEITLNGKVILNLYI